MNNLPTLDGAHVFRPDADPERYYQPKAIEVGRRYGPQGNPSFPWGDFTVGERRYAPLEGKAPEQRRLNLERSRAAWVNPRQNGWEFSIEVTRKLLNPNGTLTKSEGWTTPRVLVTREA